MFLKSIKLTNIRSYKDVMINFPVGSFLLSGDIGAGKSTILLAIEFGLFGFRPKVLDGATLLRHGKKEGSVELKLDIDGKEVIIQRNLKRSKKAIGQSSGYIIKNNKKKELTPIELKAEILEMLGYPKNILTKSKDLIYRYTVYTPQEDMKRIITEDPESRLNVLRKVFNMDKYSRIKENASIYIRILKDRMKVLEGISLGIEEKKQQKKERKKEIEDFDIRIKARKPEHDTIKKKLTDKKKNIESIEKDIRKYNELKKDIDLYNLNLKLKIENRQKNGLEIDNLSRSIEDMKKRVKFIDNDKEESLTKQIKSKEDILTHLESTIITINKKIAEFKIIKENSSKIISKITSLDRCPTCEQQVNKDYKKTIIARENTKIKDNEESIVIYKKQLSKTELEINKTKTEINELKQNLNNLEIEKMKIKNLNGSIAQIENLQKEQTKIKEEIGKINMKKLDLNTKVLEYSNVETLYNEIKKEYEQIQLDERKLALDINSLEKEREGLTLLSSSIEKEILEKEKAIDKLKIYREKRTWLEEYFINVIEIIEKHVLYSIYNEFDSLFREWFNILIEEENLQVKLDDQFTPIITQNGYDIDINNLSGGEKTSIAMAYRLALNKVINDLISTIKTNEMIILDEPTDGFSREQLDKVRDVLDQLNNKQIIIVSHEPKIETFVDSVIRISKDEHVSRISC